MVVEGITSDNKFYELLRVIKICYEYSFLNGRRLAGLHLKYEEELRLDNLARLLEGDVERKRRRQRRIHAVLPVILKTSAGLCQGTLLNVSGGGMFIATVALLAEGANVQVRIGKAGQVEYTFPSTVQWIASEPHGGRGLGLRISGIPLEVRQGPSSATAQ